MVVVLQPASQRHDALDSRLFLFQVHACLFLCLLAGCLTRRPRLQLPGHALEVVRHLGIRLEEKELQVSRLVLQLDLRPILQDV
jgi:hypothetical protein